MTLEKLKANNTEAARISSEYGRSSSTLKDVLADRARGERRVERLITDQLPRITCLMIVFAVI